MCVCVCVYVFVCSCSKSITYDTHYYFYYHHHHYHYSCFIPLLLLVYTLLRIYLIKTNAARPVAKYFNLRKSSSLSWLGILLAFVIFVACYIYMYFMYEVSDWYSKDFSDAIGLSCISSICVCSMSMFYACHVSGLIQKVRKTMQHTQYSNSNNQL